MEMSFVAEIQASSTVGPVIWFSFGMRHCSDDDFLVTQTIDYLKGIALHRAETVLVVIKEVIQIHLETSFLCLRSLR